MEELESYNREYKKRLDEVGALGEIPDDLGLEVNASLASCSFVVFTRTNSSYLN